MPYRPLYTLVEAADERGRLYEEWTTLLQWYGAEHAGRLAGRLLELGCRDIRASPHDYDEDDEPILVLPIGDWR